MVGSLAFVWVTERGVWLGEFVWDWFGGGECWVGGFGLVLAVLCLLCIV